MKAKPKVKKHRNQRPRAGDTLEVWRQIRRYFATANLRRADVDDPDFTPPMPPMKKPSTGNPIADAFCEHFSGAAGLQDRLPDSSLVKIFDNLPAIKAKLGTLLLDALTARDTTFPDAVKEAIEKVAFLFQSRRAIVEWEKVVPILATIPQPWPKGGEMRRVLEKQMGRLSKDAWRSISQALNIQGTRGAPKSAK